MAAPFDTIENIQIPCLLNKKIDNGRFLLNRRLGHGGYSVVYLATDLYARPGSAYSSRVAVKCLLDHRKHKVMREVGIHQRAAALPGVVNIFRTVQEDGLLFVVLEYCPHGDLFSAITNTRLFLGRDDLIKNVFLQLIDAVAGLHGMGIYHRDLKPENILLSAPPFMHNKKQVIKLRVLLADFGLATKSERSESFGCGSYFYMTPECLAGGYSTALKSYSSRAADVWALGIILVNLICGRSPWKTAMLSDPSFRRYNNDSRWLRQMLPLSLPAFRFLDKIFRNHGNNIGLSDLRKQFLQIETFYMTLDELAVADKTARLVASEWMPDAPLDDFNQEDPSEITYVDDIDEAQLFEDDPGGDDANSDSAPPSIAGSAATSDAEDRFASALSSAQTTSESDFPITPETKPVQPVESVPELAKSEETGQNWVLSTSQVHTFHKELTAAQDGLAIEQLHI